MNKNRPVCAGMRPGNAQSPGAESRMNVIRALHTSTTTTYMTTPKELTEQAYRLYRKLQDIQRQPGAVSYDSKKLSHAIGSALQRYDRRLKKWWASEL